MQIIFVVIALIDDDIYCTLKFLNIGTFFHFRMQITVQAPETKFQVGCLSFVAMSRQWLHLCFISY